MHRTAVDQADGHHTDVQKLVRAVDAGTEEMLLLAVGAAKLVLILGTPGTYKLDFAAYPIGAVEWLRIG